MPNDERENDRMDLQHNLFIRTFDDRLGTAPSNNTGTKVGRVLDIGTGSGIWAIDFGDEHPESEVIGVDLSVVQAGFVPSNVTFEVDDIEEPWTFSNGFDYIHSRMMTGSISDWDKYLQKCHDNLNPRGYLELNDIDTVIPLSDDRTLTEDTNLMKSVRLWHEGLAGLGRHFQEFSRFKDTLAKPKDKKHKELGIWNLEKIAPHWDGFIMAPLTRALGWTKEDVLALGKDARRDFADRNIHAYFNM
ncbi:hypothetical protein COL26b_011231 [Colletotrichum chrysophilum]|uniref:uncharacterized protein n=1 Tax=Colletotrichum chrysophilum TaxID=1836956 RepID=UPI002300B28E|nr:uncharacterized protein COL26b_011231 [Colletotrichum chrysophilum]KAJ0367628.1 hypothetical protein COL26b_011231 [Colletotrichum chrysophilum]